MIKKQIKLLKNLINLSSVNNENSTATEDIEAIYEGDEIEIGFNSTKKIICLLYTSPSPRDRG